MKVLKYLLLVLLFTASACRESSELEIKFQSDITSLHSAYNERNWEKVTSMIYPRFFLAIRRSQIIESLRMLDSIGMKRTFKLNKIEKISEPITEGNETFRRVFYNTEIVIILSRNQLPQLEKFIDDFNEDFGKENVKFEEKSLTFTINAEQSVIAVSERGKDNWSYMELNNEHAFDIVAQVVPKKIFKELTK